MPSLEAKAQELLCTGPSAEKLRDSLEAQLLRPAKKLLRTDISIVRMWDEAHRLAVNASQFLELAWHQSTSSSEVRSLDDLEAHRAASYYSVPIVSAWSPDSSPVVQQLLAPLQDLLINEVGLTAHTPLVIAKSLDEWQRIDTGSMRDLFSRVFWNHIELLYRHQRPLTPYQRFCAIYASASPHERYLPQLLVDYVGHEVHALTARDITKRHAYYLVHVPAHKEKRFLAAMESSGDMDLEDYGRVIASEYQAAFREKQDQLYRDYFTPILESYARFATRMQVYSLGGTSPSAEERADGFLERRLEAAVADAGSRTALVETMAQRAVAEGVPLPSTPDKPSHKPLFTHGITLEAAAEIAEALRARNAGTRALLALGELLIDATPERLGAVLTPCRQACALFGEDAQGFDRFETLLLAHPGLTSPEQLRKVLALAVTAPFGMLLPSVALVRSLFRGFVSQWLARHEAAAQHEASAIDVTNLHPALAVVAILLRLADVQSRPLRLALKAYCTSTNRGSIHAALDQVRQEVGAIAQGIRQDSSLIEGDAIRSAGLRVEINIGARLIGVARRPDADGKEPLFLLHPPLMAEMRSLSLLGKFIEERPASEKRALLEALIQNTLAQACEAANYPEARRATLLNEVLDALLVHDRDPKLPKTWAEKLGTERTPTSALGRAPLPASPPATWREDKQPGDTPPDFIKRHYGQWLRHDGLGLSRPDLKHLDQPLYMALNNWLRPKANGKSNTLPEDCPLPTVSERVTKELEVHAEAMPNFHRLTIARQRRQRKH